jgi:hypothetical protein
VAVTTAPPPVSTRAATRACLLQRQDAIAGLPPAVAPHVLFVYPLRRDDISSWNVTATRQPRRHTQLGAWYGDEGTILSFFASVADARASQHALAGLYGGRRIRNVLVTWDQDTAPRAAVRTMVLSCLRARAAPVTPHPPPRAALATFAGSWGGHTRQLHITTDGRGSESVDDGCCHRVENMTFRIVSVRGTITHATAIYRVTSIRRFTRDVPMSRLGQTGTLVLRNGIVTNTRTTVYFCSDPAWGATGACGA